MLPNEQPQPGPDSVCLYDTDTIEDLARKIIQSSPGMGWHTAWIKAVRMFEAMK